MHTDMQNVMKYRSRIDITAQILEAAIDDTTKTKIMCHAFLSYDGLQEYLTASVKSGLLHHDAYAHVFKTTEKGYRFISLYNQLTELLKNEPEYPTQHTVLAAVGS